MQSLSFGGSMDSIPNITNESPDWEKLVVDAFAKLSTNLDLKFLTEDGVRAALSLLDIGLVNMPDNVTPAQCEAVTIASVLLLGGYLDLCDMVETGTYDRLETGWIDHIISLEESLISAIATVMSEHPESNWEPREPKIIALTLATQLQIAFLAPTIASITSPQAQA